MAVKRTINIGQLRTQSTRSTTVSILIISPKPDTRVDGRLMMRDGTRESKDSTSETLGQAMVDILKLKEVALTPVALTPVALTPVLVALTL